MPRAIHNVGYNRFSLMRASALVKCKSALACLALRNFADLDAVLSLARRLRGLRGTRPCTLDAAGALLREQAGLTRGALVAMPSAWRGKTAPLISAGDSALAMRRLKLSQATIAAPTFR